MTWENICLLLDQYEEVRERYYGGIGIERAERIDANIPHIKDGVESLTARNAGSQLK
ncbi:MAG: hypothetical protein M3Y27_12855 [Acidobacteriota bacterium]|nr:hypothetical protein [Acidobacteriota bacterium]